MCGIGLILVPFHHPIQLDNVIDNLIDNNDCNKNNKNNNNQDEATTYSKAQSNPMAKANTTTTTTISTTTSMAMIHQISKAVAPRGPDLAPNSHSHRYQRRITMSNAHRGEWEMTMLASVLHMRGSNMTPQPFVVVTRPSHLDGDDNNNGGGGVGGEVRSFAFCWNGECYAHRGVGDGADGDLSSRVLFDVARSKQSAKNGNNGNHTDYDNDGDNVGGNGNDVEEKKEAEETSDTDLVLSALMKAMLNYSKGDNGNHYNNYTNDDNQDLSTDFDDSLRKRDGEHGALAQALAGIHGEYSFLLHCSSDHEIKTDLKADKEKKERGGCIYFGRDFLGRRSLLMTKIHHHHHPPSVDTNINANVNVDTTVKVCSLSSLSSFCISSVAPSPSFSRDATTINNTNNNHNQFKINNNNDEETCTFPDMEEIVPGRVYRIDLETGEMCYKNIPTNSIFTPILSSTDIKIKTNAIHEHDAHIHTNTNIDIDPETSIRKASKHLHALLDQAVRRRVLNAPLPTSTTNNSNHNIQTPPPPPKTNCHTPTQATVAVLFSGGIDSVVLAALSHRHIPTDQPIDLINVAFANHTDTHTHPNTNRHQDPYSASPDRQAALLSLHELREKWPQRQWNFIAVNVPYSQVLDNEERVCALVAPRASTMDFNIGAAFWFASRGIGVLSEDGIGAIHNVGVSAGDNTALKASMDQLRFAPIHNNRDDNDATNTPNTHAQQQSTKLPCITQNCPRIGSSDCIFQSCKLCCSSYRRPIHQFLGGCADICSIHNSDRNRTTKKKNKNKNKNGKHDKNSMNNVKEKNKNRQQKQPIHIQQDNNNHHRHHSGSNNKNNNNKFKEQMSTTSTKTTITSKCNTDDKTNLNDDSIDQNHKIKTTVTSTARVILVGIGADEQMAGYGRHRSTYTRGGYEALRSELIAERSRLWTRNLGRDDRCISDSGREARFPYLDEDVVSYLQALDMREVCDMDRPPGEGDKMILRFVAREIGTEQCSGLVKRAIQFGSRIAKCSDVDRFGSSRKASGSARHGASSNCSLSQRNIDLQHE